jgi:hypothetical protein
MILPAREVYSIAETGVHTLMLDFSAELAITNQHDSEVPLIPLQSTRGVQEHPVTLLWGQSPDHGQLRALDTLGWRRPERFVQAASDNVNLAVVDAWG